MGRVGDALVDSLRQQTDGLNIRAYAVNYKATITQRHGGDGAKDAISHIKSIASSCPDTKIVLGGYSQGASVVNIVAGFDGINWGDPLPPEYVKNIAAVATFGNVADRTDGPPPPRIRRSVPRRSTCAIPATRFVTQVRATRGAGTHRAMSPSTPTRLRHSLRPRFWLGRPIRRPATARRSRCTARSRRPMGHRPARDRRSMAHRPARSRGTDFSRQSPFRRHRPSRSCRRMTRNYPRPPMGMRRHRVSRTWLA